MNNHAAICRFAISILSPQTDLLSSLPRCLTHQLEVSAQRPKDPDNINFRLLFIADDRQ